MRLFELLVIYDLGAVCIRHIFVYLPKLLHLFVILKAHRPGKRGYALVDYRVIGVNRVDGEAELIARLDIAISRSRPIANLYTLSALGEIEHCDSTRATVHEVSLIHSLGVDKNVGDGVAIFALPL